MFELEKAVVKDRQGEIEDLCQNLVREWLLDLNYQEKEIWLWNALVEMAKIKQRRRSM